MPAIRPSSPWAARNDYFHGNKEMLAQKMVTPQEWKKMYADGTVTKWLQQVTDFFMTNANVKDSTLASKYFDPSLYISTIA